MKSAFNLLLATAIAFQFACFVGCAHDSEESNQAQEPVPVRDSAAKEEGEQLPQRELASEKPETEESALPNWETRSDLPPIVREPVYHSTPKYTVLAIGPERRKMLWTVADLDSSLVYVDFNGNGDLTETEEAVRLRETTKIGDTRNWLATISEISDGDDVHTNFKLKFSRTGEEVKGVFSMMLWGWDESTIDADLIPLTLPTNAAGAPVVHFNGPLFMGPYRSQTDLPAGKEVDFYSQVGTPGDGVGTFAAISNTSIPPDCASDGGVSVSSPRSVQARTRGEDVSYGPLLSQPLSRPGSGPNGSSDWSRSRQDLLSRLV